MFFGSCAASPFLGTTSAMAKSAVGIDHLLNVSEFDNSALVDVISDLFEDCSSRDAEEVGFISKDFPETGT